MITLHESNITSFPLDNGIGVLRDAIVAYAEEELNGMFEFYMEYDSEGFLVDELKEERIIKAKAQDKLGYQLFRIYSITKNHENDNVIVHAQHITYDLANNFVEKLEANSMTKKQVMELIGSSAVIPHPFNVTSSNTTTVSSTNLYRTNPLQMIAGTEGSVLQIWGGQIERDNFNLILHDRRGHDDGVTVTFEKNITGLEANFDISGVITRIFPFIYIEATDDSPERLITVSGKYIDSPHINDYEVIRTEPIDYSNDDRIDTQDKTDAQIRQQLERVAKDYFKETGNDKIKSEMEVQFAHLWETEEYKDVKVLELVGMGDTVTTNHSKLKVNATAIVNYIKYDCIAQVNEEVKLGSVKSRLTDSINKIDTIERKVEQAQTSANQAIVSANGKNTTFYGPDEPTTGMQKGDLWFQVIDGQYHKTYRYDGIDWQPILDMDSQEAKEEARQARDRADESVERANQATQLANNAINQAQTSFDLAQESLTLGQGLTSRMTDAEGNLTALNQTTQSLAGQLSDVEGNIITLTATVDGLQTTVSDVQGNVANLTVVSNAMQARLSNAEGNINTLTLTSQSMQSTIRSLQDEISDVNLVKKTGTENIDRSYEIDINTSNRPFETGTYSIEKIEEENVIYIDSYSTLVTEKKLNSKNGLHYVEFDVKYEKNLNGTVYAQLLFYNKNGTSAGSNYLALNFVANERVQKLNSWQSFSGFLKADDFSIQRKNAYYVAVRVLVRYSGYNEPTYIRNLSWKQLDGQQTTQSQITQLSDAINLRVAKGDVINQINLDTSGVLIGGDKILLDGNVTVTGDFKVGNANITSLNAGKITSGTLDAGKISVINLSANSIVGGILSSQNDNMTLDMNTGRLHMERVDFTLGSGANIEFLDRNNRLFYANKGIYAGIQFDHTLNSDGRPMIGIGVSDGRHSVNDSTFRGIRIHSLGAEGLGYGTNIISQEFGVYSLADLSGSGYVFRLHALDGRRAIYPRYTGRFSYDLGTSLNKWTDVHADNIRSKTIHLRNPVGTGGWRLDTQPESGSTVMTFRGINTSTWNYNIGASGYRINRIYLSNSPDVSSDERLKTDISNNALGLDFINDVNTVNYRLNKLPCDVGNLKQNGVIAQQLLPVLVKHGVDVNDTMLVRLNDDGYYSVAYEQFIAPLIKSVQELDIKLTDNVDFLKLKVQYLEQKIKQLEGVA